MHPLLWHQEDWRSTMRSLGLQIADLHSWEVVVFFHFNLKVWSSMWHSKLLALQTCWTNMNFLSTANVQSGMPTLYRWVGGKRSKGITDPQWGKTYDAFGFPSSILIGYFAAHPCKVWEIRWPGEWQWKYSWIKEGQLKTRTKHMVPGAAFWMDGGREGLQPLLTSLSPCPPFAFSRLRAPNPSLSAARHKLHKGRGLVSNKPWAKISSLSLALLVTAPRGAAALSLNSFPRLLPCP